MLKKLGWAIIALVMLAGLARASGDGAGGMSIASLSANITTALGTLSTAITTAISGSSVPTTAPGSPAAAGFGVQGLGPTATPVNTAPQSGTPNIHTTTTISAINTPVSLPVGPLAGLGVQVGGSPTGLALTAACSQDKGATYPVPLRFAYKGVLALTNAPVASVTAVGNYKLVGADCDAIQFTATALTSGSATLDIAQTAAWDRMGVFNTPAEPLNVVSPAVAVTPTDRGGTIATASTSQQVAAANTSRKGLFCMNPVAATEDLFFAVTGGATVGGASNFADVAPGGSVAFALNGLPILTAIQVNAATAGHRFSCTEIQ